MTFTTKTNKPKVEQAQSRTDFFNERSQVTNVVYTIAQIECGFEYFFS